MGNEAYREEALLCSITGERTGSSPSTRGDACFLAPLLKAVASRRGWKGLRVLFRELPFQWVAHDSAGKLELLTQEGDTLSFVCAWTISSCVQRGTHRISGY